MQIFIDTLAAYKPNNLIKREKVLKAVNNTHNKPMTQEKG